MPFLWAQVYLLFIKRLIEGVLMSKGTWTLIIWAEIKYITSYVIDTDIKWVIPVFFKKKSLPFWGGRELNILFIYFYVDL